MQNFAKIRKIQFDNLVDFENEYENGNSKKENGYDFAGIRRILPDFDECRAPRNN